MRRILRTKRPNAAIALLGCFACLLFLLPSAAFGRGRQQRSANGACCCGATCAMPCSQKGTAPSEPCPESCVATSPMAHDAVPAPQRPSDESRSTVTIEQYRADGHSTGRPALLAALSPESPSESPPDSPPAGLTLSQIVVRRN